MAGIHAPIWKKTKEPLYKALDDTFPIIQRNYQKSITRLDILSKNLAIAHETIRTKARIKRMTASAKLEEANNALENSGLAHKPRYNNASIEKDMINQCVIVKRSRAAKGQFLSESKSKLDQKSNVAETDSKHNSFIEEKT